jgi:RNA polymerase sigma-70 factor, ECF subfamily
MEEQNNEWFIEQVRREQAALRAFVRSLGVSSETVDDLAQDALILAHEKLAEFDRSLEFGPWVRGIARRLVANMIRKEARRAELMSQAVTEALLVHDHGGVPASVASEDHLQALNCCLDSMPDRSRELVKWRYFEDLTPQAIADRLGRSSNEVRQTFFRLRQSLLQCIERRLGNVENQSAS